MRTILASTLSRKFGCIVLKPHSFPVTWLLTLSRFYSRRNSGTFKTKRVHAAQVERSGGVWTQSWGHFYSGEPFQTFPQRRQKALQLDGGTAILKGWHVLLFSTNLGSSGPQFVFSGIKLGSSRLFEPAGRPIISQKLWNRYIVGLIC